MLQLLHREAMMRAIPIADTPDQIEGEPRVLAFVPMGPSGELVECVLLDLTDDEMHAVTRGWTDSLSFGATDPGDPKLLLEKALERREEDVMIVQPLPLSGGWTKVETGLYTLGNFIMEHGRTTPSCVGWIFTAPGIPPTYVGGTFREAAANATELLRHQTR